MKLDVQQVESSAPSPEISQSLQEAKVLDGQQSPVQAFEKTEEVKFHVHSYLDESKGNYLEKMAPKLAQKIPESVRPLVSEKTVDFLAGRYQPGKFSGSLIAASSELARHGLNEKEITKLIEGTYPSHEKLSKARAKASRPEGATVVDRPTLHAVVEAPTRGGMSVVNEVAPETAPANEKKEDAQAKGPDVDDGAPIKAEIKNEVQNLPKEPSVGLNEIKDMSKDINKIKRDLVVDQARDLVSGQKTMTLGEVRELSKELNRIRREMLVEKIDQAKDEMFETLKEVAQDGKSFTTGLARGGKNLALAVGEWLSEIKDHVGELTKDAIERFKEKGHVAEYATLFKSAMQDPEKFMKGKQLFESDYENVEKKLIEESGAEEKPPRILVRLYANTLANRES
jgi:alanyl-tRNA synthetase